MKSLSIGQGNQLSGLPTCDSFSILFAITAAGVMLSGGPK